MVVGLHGLIGGDDLKRDLPKPVLGPKGMRTLTSHLFHARQHLSRSELLAYVVMLVLATFVLTPRFWELGGESWKYWASARILRETGGFPVFSHGPLYVAYLQFFLFFDYPLSIQLEYFVTHLFCYVAMFLMLRSVLPSISAFLLTCAWIPIIAFVEGGTVVAGSGFLALYCRRSKHSALNEGYFPPLLGAAALCHSAYIPFLMAHVFGVLLERRARKQPILVFFHRIREVRVLPLMINATLALLVILTVFFPSHRSDHNHMLMDPTYAPIPLRDPLTIGFFQIGNYKYVMRNVPESIWIYQDWYFTNEKAFAGASTILQGVLNKPETFVRNILENVRPAAKLPIFFITGSFAGLEEVAVLFWVLLLIGFVGMVQHFKANGLRPLIFSITLGTAAVVGCLFLTWFKQRYVMILLPVGLLVVAHIGPGLQSLVKFLVAGISSPPPGTVMKGNSREGKILFVLGLLLILLGIFSNEWILATLFSPDGVLLFSTRLLIWLLDILFITSGTLLIIKRDFLLAIVKHKDSWYINTDSWYTNAIVLVSAVYILSTAYYPHGKVEHIEAVFGNRALLSGATPLSMVAAHRELLAGVDERMSVLAAEDTWIKAFTKVNLDRVYNVFSLPPFADPTGNTERMLNSLDAIWVSYNWPREKPSVATQQFLRYHLHVAPFLEKAMAKGWTTQEVNGYGKIYRPPFSKRSN